MSEISNKKGLDKKDGVQRISNYDGFKYAPKNIPLSLNFDLSNVEFPPKMVIADIEGKSSDATVALGTPGNIDAKISSKKERQMNSIEPVTDPECMPESRKLLFTSFEYWVIYFIPYL